MSEWINAEVKEVKKWNETLFSLKMTAPIDSFIAGQFAKIALEINGERIVRAYSYVNAPKDPLLEFYFVAINGGRFSTRLQFLKFQEKIMITKRALGFFTLDQVPNSTILWMLATGTAIGPYLSILQQAEGLDRFKNIVLVHAVRYISDLSFFPLMKNLEKSYNGKLRILAIISREKKNGFLFGRIPDLIKSGDLERSIGLEMNFKNSHVMLCGNPDMVHDTQNLLKRTRNMFKNLKQKSGHVTSEQYW